MGAYNSNGDYRGDLNPDSPDAQNHGYIYRSDPTNSSSEFSWILTPIVRLFPFKHWKAFIPGFVISWLFYSIAAVIAGFKHNQLSQMLASFAADSIFPAILLNIIIYKRRLKKNENKIRHK